MGEYIIPGIFAVIVAIIETIAAKERSRVKKENAKIDSRAAVRAEESRLSMEMMSATLQLSVVTANALTGGHNNGNVNVARKAAQEAMAKYTEFVNKIAAKEVARI